MKKAIRQSVSVVIFLICFFVLFRYISEVFRRKTGAELDMVHSFYDIEENTLDVLCLGSSHAYYGFQPNALWGETGITSYTMASPQQTIAMSYFLLKEALNYQKPKVVLLESYYFWFDGLQTKEAVMRQAFDGMRYGEAKKEMLNTFFPDLSLKEKVPYYISFMKYHSRWEGGLKKQDFHTKSYLKGSRMDFGVKQMEDPGMDIEAVPVPEVNLEYFEKIAGLCRENGAELVVFATPYGTIDNYESYAAKQGKNFTLEPYFAEKGIPFLFYQKTGEAQIRFEEDFRDSTHLNIFGAEKVTKCLADYLSENYDLPSHKNDPEYASWEADYLQYCADIEKKTDSGSTEEE